MTNARISKAGNTQTDDVHFAYTAIDPNELVKNADHHQGEKVMISGSIFFIAGSNGLQIYANGQSNLPVEIQTANPLSGTYNKTSYVKVYGTVAGFDSVSNPSGQTIQMPKIIDAIVS
jgi:hypothetical protein